MKYYENDPKLNGIYSRDNLPNKIKDGTYVINVNEYSDIGTHWVALWVNNNNVTYFDSFGAEYIPKEITKFIENRNIKTNIFRIQANDSVMCGYFCIGFIDFMFKGKTLTEYTNTLTAEKIYSINFTATKKKFCLSLRYNGGNNYLFVNGTEIIKIKAKDSEIVASPLCLGNISKDWSTDIMKKTGLTGYVYDFSADYNAITIDYIKDIHNYLMKKMI